MMLKFVLSLSYPDATIANVGGKGMSLAKMSQAGLLVATGFRVTTEAYRRFVSENGLQPGILAALEKVNASDPVALEAVSREIRFTKPPVVSPTLHCRGRSPTDPSEPPGAAAFQISTA